jgi:hypothetical protein
MAAVKVEKIVSATFSDRELPVQTRRELLHGKPGEVPVWMQERQRRRSQPITKEHKEFREVFDPLD